jgi:hypothetical protein
MKVRTKTFWLPKRGNSTEEYEDAAWPVDPVDCETNEFKCAVADGATEASFSRRWAQLLVKGFEDGTEITKLAEDWSSEIKEMALPWYAQEKAEAGAFSTFTGLTLLSSGTAGGTYAAKLLGDSCVFHMRGEKLLESMPLTSYECFNNSPALLCSNLSIHDDADAMFTAKNGTWESGDRFLLVTDAIAAWTFKRQLEHGDGFKTLFAIECQEELDKLCQNAREEQDEEGRPNMRNDDVTLLVVEVLS